MCFVSERGWDGPWGDPRLSCACRHFSQYASKGRKWVNQKFRGKENKKEKKHKKDKNNRTGEKRKSTAEPDDSSAELEDSQDECSEGAAVVEPSVDDHAAVEMAKRDEDAADRESSSSCNPWSAQHAMLASGDLSMLDTDWFSDMGAWENEAVRKALGEAARMRMSVSETKKDAGTAEHEKKAKTAEVQKDAETARTEKDAETAEDATAQTKKDAMTAKTETGAKTAEREKDAKTAETEKDAKTAEKEKDAKTADSKEDGSVTEGRRDAVCPDCD